MPRPPLDSFAGFRKSRITHRVSIALSFLVCCSLLFSLLVLAKPTLNGQGTTRSGLPPSTSGLLPSGGLLSSARALVASLFTLPQGGPPSVPGANLPDLDTARQTQFADPAAPAAIASTQACSDCTPCPTCGPGSANHAPVAAASGPYYGTAGAPTLFNGLGSFDVDPADGINDYAWSFGDNTATVHGATPSHTYQTAGTYTVTITVTDRHSTPSASNTTAAITAAAAPTPSPSPGSAQGNGAAFVSQTVPMTMTAGQRYPVSVTMRNTGSTTWSARIYIGLAGRTRRTRRITVGHGERIASIYQRTPLRVLRSHLVSRSALPMARRKQRPRLTFSGGWSRTASSGSAERTTMRSRFLLAPRPAGPVKVVRAMSTMPGWNRQIVPVLRERTCFPATSVGDSIP